MDSDVHTPGARARLELVNDKSNIDILRVCVHVNPAQVNTWESVKRKVPPWNRFS